jgi:hypothetical protein
MHSLNAAKGGFGGGNANRMGLYPGVDVDDMVIDLSNRSLSQLSAQAFVQYPKLQKLMLHHNHLGNNINIAAFNGMKIKELSLAYCGLTSVPSALYAIKDTLRVLDISYNPIVKFLGADFAGLKLTALKISYTFTKKSQSYLHAVESVLKLRLSLETLQIYFRYARDSKMEQQSLSSPQLWCELNIFVKGGYMFNFAPPVCRNRASKCLPNAGLHVYDRNINGVS